MKNTLTLGVLLLSPALTFAHDGEHIVSSWYKDPLIISSILLVAGLLGWLGYSWLTKKKQLIVVPTIALIVITITGFVTFNQKYTSEEAMLITEDFGTGQIVTLYKSPNCGCCSGHAKVLEEAGFTVNIVETSELDKIKSEQNIPPTGASCHTSVIGDYVVEGHVPLEAIEKLLTEKPAVAGIGLPGMPIGTPGMPGRKTAPYEVYQLSNDGQMSPYVTI